MVLGVYEFTEYIFQHHKVIWISMGGNMKFRNLITIMDWVIFTIHLSTMQHNKNKHSKNNNIKKKQKRLTKVRRQPTYVPTPSTPTPRMSMPSD